MKPPDFETLGTMKPPDLEALGIMRSGHFAHLTSSRRLCVLAYCFFSHKVDSPRYVRCDVLDKETCSLKGFTWKKKRGKGHAPLKPSFITFQKTVLNTT